METSYRPTTRVTPRRRSSAGVDFVASLIGGLVSYALTGWMFMLAVGVVHHEWISKCPTIGFFWACVLSSLLRGGLDIPSSLKRDH